MMQTSIGHQTSVTSELTTGFYIHPQGPRPDQGSLVWPYQVNNQVNIGIGIRHRFCFI